MTGRDLYEQWCRLSGELPEGRPRDFTRLELDRQLAWEDLAEWATKAIQLRKAAA